MTPDDAAPVPERTDLVPLMPDEIGALFASWGEQPYRGLQVFSWIHARRVASFDEMTNLSKSLRARLAESCTVSRLDPVDILDAKDGTRKLLFDAPGGGRYNAVLMPSEDRVTLCISSQIGCRMGCRFCLTASLKFRRSLTAAEIVGQVLAASRLLPEGSRVTNVVFMGMGEPLDNLDEVVRAVRVMTHREGLRVAPRKTTVSTVGLLPQMRTFLEANTGASLALSLCATQDDVRSQVAPAVKKYPLDDTVQALRSMPLAHGHTYTIEYQLIPGVGASIDDAKRLSRLLAHFPAKVNLIPFNPWPGAPYRSPTADEVELFRRVLAEKNHRVTVRWSRGADIGAACGQLDGRGTQEDEA